MLPDLRNRAVVTGLVVGLTMVVGATETYAQGYATTPGGGCYYVSPANRGYTYPAYAYTYWGQGRSTVPSGYYAYPADGPYDYQPFAPAAVAPAPVPSAPAG